MSDIFRDTFLGFVRVHLLWHACRARIYGAEMIEELRHHGYDVSPGTIYPILHAMQKAGLLDTESEVEGGRVRKYYRATAEGGRVLLGLQERIREMSAEVLRETPCANGHLGRGGDPVA
jgi:DNA-binding PadR family transcriptional regulator